MLLGILFIFCARNTLYEQNSVLQYVKTGGT
jgi:hypothetical protein